MKTRWLKMVEDWVADSVVRLSVDRRTNLACPERAMRTGLTRVTTDDVRTIRKVIGREREEVEEKMGGDSEEISSAQTTQGWPRSRACPFLPPLGDSCLTVPTNLLWDRIPR